MPLAESAEARRTSLRTYRDSEQSHSALITGRTTTCPQPVETNGSASGIVHILSNERSGSGPRTAIETEKDFQPIDSRATVPRLSTGSSRDRSANTACPLRPSTKTPGYDVRHASKAPVRQASCNVRSERGDELSPALARRPWGLIKSCSSARNASGFFIAIHPRSLLRGGVASDQDPEVSDSSSESAATPRQRDRPVLSFG